MQLVSLRDQLLRLEEECVEVLQELLKEFDRNYSEMAETNKVNYNQYFTQVGGRGRVWLRVAVAVCPHATRATCLLNMTWKKCGTCLVAKWEWAWEAWAAWYPWHHGLRGHPLNRTGVEVNETSLWGAGLCALCPGKWVTW